MKAPSSEPKEDFEMKRFFVFTLIALFATACLLVVNLNADNPTDDDYGTVLDNVFVEAYAATYGSAPTPAVIWMATSVIMAGTLSNTTAISQQTCRVPDGGGYRKPEPTATGSLSANGGPGTIMPLSTCQTQEQAIGRFGHPLT